MTVVAAASHPFRRAVPAGLAVGALVVVAAACGGGGGGVADGFCGEVDESKGVLTAPDIVGAEDPQAAIDEVIGEYRRIGELAPLVIEDEWDQLTAAYEAADAVDVTEPDAEQEALETIYRSERAAETVAQWVRKNCKVRLGPVATVAPVAAAPDSVAPDAP